MLYRLNLINSYTNISIDFKNSLDEFNLLNKSDVIDLMLSYIPKKELEEFNMLLEMVKNDFITNEYETKAFISGQVEKFAEIFGTVISPVLTRLGDTLENVDDKTLENIFVKAKNMAEKFK